MYNFITDIDYIHWQSCGEDVLMLIMTQEMLSCDVLKIYINVTCTIQYTRDISVTYA